MRPLRVCKDALSSKRKCTYIVCFDCFEEPKRSTRRNKGNIVPTPSRTRNKHQQAQHDQSCTGTEGSHVSENLMTFTDTNYYKGLLRNISNCVPTTCSICRKDVSVTPSSNKVRLDK